MTAFLNRPFGIKDTNFSTIPDSYDDEAFRGDYDGNNNLIYAGFARPGSDVAQPVWQIKKLTYDGNNNLLSITWPVVNGITSNDYQFIWNNRTTLTYA